jgi:hypothetical protein
VHFSNFLGMQTKLPAAKAYPAMVTLFSPCPIEVR